MKPAWQEKTKSQRDKRKRKDRAVLTTNRQFSWAEQKAAERRLLGVLEHEEKVQKKSWEEVNTHPSDVKDIKQPFTHTCAEVSLRQGLQDGVHGPHVEDEAKLGHAHGDKAQQEDGTEDTFHEGLSCRGNERGEGQG